MSTSETLRYTLTPRNATVHAVERMHTLCGLSMAFAGYPEETEADVDCASCLRKLAKRQASEPERVR
jgi:hypothetical protein